MKYEVRRGFQVQVSTKGMYPFFTPKSLRDAVVLLHLKIRNFATIKELEVDFGSGFSILTGETGAGKSILPNNNTPTIRVIKINIILIKKNLLLQLLVIFEN